MKLSYNWLSDFVDLTGISPEELAEKLTMGAFEVEEILPVGVFGPIVVGEIQEISPHPNADKIRLTKVLLASGQESKEIVCGAANIEVGQRIPVALPGAKVINRHDGSPLEIRQNKIRGVMSNGMLCSAPELGVEGDGEGILILDSKTPIGSNAAELLGLDGDHVLIVEPRSNRGDALSVLGLAREVAALFGLQLKGDTWLEEFAAMKADPAFGSLNIKIENVEDCPFFYSRVLAGLKVGPAPAFISKRLETVGIRSVNNVVDVTNYVLHEMGQPLHAYDLKAISGPSLEARRARVNEELITLDGKTRTLNSECLIIADGKGPVGVAGVMGGKQSEVSDHTESIVLEAASFNAARVRRSSRTLGLSSDSSLRFERGVDTASVKRCADKAAYLMVKYCGAKLGEGFSAGSDQAEIRKVTMRVSELKRITEIDLIPEQAADLLSPLGFKSAMSATDFEAGILRVTVPSFRQRDVSREIDLIEEVCRLWGYSKIPVSLPKGGVVPERPDTFFSHLRNSLVGCGLSEVWTSSLCRKEDLAVCSTLSSVSETGYLSVLNPLSPDHEVLRQSLLPGLLRSVAYNQARGRAHVQLFEIGRVYEIDPNFRSRGEEFKHKETGSREPYKLAAILSGNPDKLGWMNEGAKENGEVLFFKLKGRLESLLRSLSVELDSLSYVPPSSEWQFLHPGRSALIELSSGSKKSEAKVAKKQPTRLGFIGELHPRLCEAFALRERSCVFELDLQTLRALTNPAKFQTIFTTPSMHRDITVDVSDKTAHQEVEKLIKSAGGELLRELSLVSVFTLGQDSKSLSYRLSFQHREETLTADTIDSLMADIRSKLSTCIGASFRL